MDLATGQSRLIASTDPSIIGQSDFIIVAVPTPSQNAAPDTSFPKRACLTIGSNLHQNSIVVFESTVYPGMTEDVCVPLLEQISGFSCGRDFEVAYCPERVNVADPSHPFSEVTKVISASSNYALDRVEKLYSLVQRKGFYRAKSIKDAEAIKLFENVQHDMNIAFMNYLARYAHYWKEIDFKDAIQGMGTKWNSLGFVPGLVGGHCIGADTLYLIYHLDAICRFVDRVIVMKQGEIVGDGSHSDLIASCKAYQDLCYPQSKWYN